MILLAVDGGGTGCRAVAADAQGRVLGRGESGAANIMTDLEGALIHVLEASERALTMLGLTPDALASCHAVLAMAGANVGDYAAALRSRLPFAESIVETDASAAVRGALGPHDGAVAIVGTGSVFGGRSRGDVRMIGGWGFLLGDQASGARLGRALLEEALLAHDGVRPGSALTERVLARFGKDPRAVVSFGKEARPGDFGVFAPDIFAFAEKGDSVAGQLVADGVAAIEAALDAVMPGNCDRLCLLGGLGEPYAPYLGARYRAILKPALGTALDGALTLAVERFGNA